VIFVAGGGPGCNDASGESAGFTKIKALVIDGNDDLLVVDQHCIRKVTLQRGEVVTICGSANEAGHVDGVGCSARFKSPNGVCVDEDNNLYVADTDNHRIRKVRTGDEGRRWEVTTIAGDGQTRDVDAQGTAASMHSPSDVVCIDGWLYVVERSTVRCVSPTGHVTTIAGSTTSGYRDMVGSDARFNSSVDGRIASDGNGMCVLTDVGNKRLRSFQVRIESSVEIPPSTLEADLEGLMSDEEATDLKIVVEGKNLYTLRGLLTSRSGHFRTMLTSGFSESSSNEIALTEDSFEAVRAVLLYLHTDRLEVSDQYAVEVLRLSMLWELPRLQALTQDFITRRVTASSVCSFLSAADKHSAPGLRAFCVRYIVLNFGSVQASGNFASLDKDLLCEVIQSIRM